MTADPKALRKQCSARLREIAIPCPFDVRALCERVAQRRQRPIVLQSVITDRGPCGLWLAHPQRDLIFYDSATSAFHQEHIILHELSHILCGHRPSSPGDAPVPEHLFPDLPVETIQLLLQRTVYSNEEEREAEMLASMILAASSAAPPTGASTLDAETAWLRERIARERRIQDERTP